MLESPALEERSSVCSNCKSSMEITQDYCQQCGFPENKEDKEKDQFHYRIKLKKNVLAEAQKKLKNVKILLFILAALNLIVGIFYASTLGVGAEFLGCMISAAVFVGCAFWVDKQALTGILAAFIFYLLLQVISIIISPVNIFSGILWKIIIITVFIKGINSAKDYKDYKAQLSEMGVGNG